MQKFFFRGQGSLEYLLIIGLVILVSAIVITVLPSLLSNPANQLPAVNDAYSALHSQGNIPLALRMVNGAGDNRTFRIELLNDSSSAPLIINNYVGPDGVTRVYSPAQTINPGETLWVQASNSSCGCNNSCTLTFGTNLGDYNVPVDRPCQAVANITSCAELQAISNNLSGNYLLTDSFDCAGINGGFVPIGTSTAPFTGVFDGAGFTVSGLVLVPDVDGLGLFGFVDGGGVVENLTLDNISVASGSFGNSFVSKGRVSFSEESDKCAGWLTAKLGSGVVRNGFVYNVSRSPNNDSRYLGVGGLVGCMYANSSVLRCSSSSPVVSVVDNAGGLVGYNFGGTITDSNATGSVSGLNNVGGLVGNNSSNAKVISSFASGNVTGSGGNVGGLVGYNYNNSSVSGSSAFGSVTGSGVDVGGLVGYNYYISTVSDSSASGSVTGFGNNVGGLIGKSSQSSADISTINKSNASGAVHGAGSNVGGLVGANSYASHVKDSFSSSVVSGGSSVGGLIGDNAECLVNNSYAVGDVNGTNNIGGLVGSNSSASDNGAVINSSFAGGNITGKGNVGGLVGYNFRNDVIYSYSTGKVKGDNNVGGLVGYAYYYSAVDSSFSVGDVNGLSNVGGLVGSNNRYSAVRTSFSVSKVIGGSSVGGLVGRNERWSGVDEDSYWDITRSTKNTCCGFGNDACWGNGVSATDLGYSTWWYVSSNPPLNLWTSGDWVFISGGAAYPRLSWEQ